MTIFVDSSAMVAMIVREPEATHFGDRLMHDPERLTSSLAIWETVRAVARVRGLPFGEARSIVRAFLTALGVTVVPIGSEEGELALDAHEKYGRGVDPAELNMGDCFSYACTKRHGAKILFKGDDFSRTDLPDAILS